MSSLGYNNPNTPYKAGVQSSIPSTSTIGVTFSVFDTGGYMELYNFFIKCRSYFYIRSTSDT